MATGSKREMARAGCTVLSLCNTRIFLFFNVKLDTVIRRSRKYPIAKSADEAARGIADSFV